MSRKPKPDERLFTDLEAEREGVTPRQRSAVNDPAMRDGDSSHGTPDWTAEDEPTTDNDVGDAIGPDGPYSGISGGAVGGTPAGDRASGGRTEGGIAGNNPRGDSTVGTSPDEE